MKTRNELNSKFKGSLGYIARLYPQIKKEQKKSEQKTAQENILFWIYWDYWQTQIYYYGRTVRFMHSSNKIVAILKMYVSFSW